MLTTLQDWITERTPRAAEHLLLGWLDQTESDEVRELIARVLTQKGFGRSVGALIKAFRVASNDGTRWAIGNAIVHIGFTQNHWSELVDLASERRLGPGRQMIVGALHRLKAPDTESVLLSLLNDGDVDAFALRALSFCSSDLTYEHLQTLSGEGRSPLFKRTLTSALRRLEKRLKKR